MTTVPRLVYFGLPPGISPRSGYAKWFSDVYDLLTDNGSINATYVDYNPMLLNPYTSRTYLVSVSYLLLRMAAESRFLRSMDILHILNQLPHLSRIIPTISAIKSRSEFKTVLTIHDIQKADGRLDLSIPKSAEKADCIFVPSEYTRDSLRNILGVASEIRVTYNPVDLNRYHPYDPARTARIRERFLCAHSCPEDSRIILYVGSEMPRKNIPGLLQVLSILVAEDSTYQLVILTRPSHLRGRYISTAKRLGVIDNVIWLDYLDEEDLPGLYNLADVFITLSKGEGFCVPAVEAMACGKHVIASNFTSLPEIVGEGGKLVDPDDHETVARLVSGISGNPWKSAIVHKAIEQADKFSCETVASRYVRFYSDLLAGDVSDEQ